MRKSTDIAGAVLLALLGGGPAWALSTDKDQPIEIEADFAELDESAGRTVYTGNVIVVQGSIRMTGDRLRVNLDDNNDLDQVFLEGRPAEFKQRPDDAENDIVGRAINIEYQAKQNLLTLIDSARVTRGEELFEGYRISYDTERSIITARALQASDQAPSTEPAAGGRVRIVIPPRKKETP
jgi:lipopolysaccharide export system protein LptA